METKIEMSGIAEDTISKISYEKTGDARTFKNILSYYGPAFFCEWIESKDWSNPYIDQDVRNVIRVVRGDALQQHEDKMMQNLLNGERVRLC